jgi:hypothetical protein
MVSLAPSVQKDRKAHQGQQASAARRAMPGRMASEDQMARRVILALMASPVRQASVARRV